MNTPRLGTLINAIFKTSDLTGRSGQRVIRAPLLGPSLKSYWPNSLLDICRPWNRPSSSEVPIQLSPTLPKSLLANFHTLPVSLHRVYRENISEWRKRRGVEFRKGEAKVSSNLKK